MFALEITICLGEGRFQHDNSCKEGVYIQQGECPHIILHGNLVTYVKNTKRESVRRERGKHLEDLCVYLRLFMDNREVLVRYKLCFCRNLM